MPLSITSRISRAAFLMTMAVVLILGSGSYFFTRHTIKAQIEKTLTFEAAMINNRLEIRLENIHNDIRNMSTNLVVVNALLDSAGREMYVEPFFNSYRTQHNLSFLLTLCDFQGHPLISSQGKEKFKSYTDATLLNQIITNQQPFVHLENDGDKTTLLIAYPVFYAATGMAEGILAIETPLNTLIEFALPHVHNNSETFYKLSGTQGEIWITCKTISPSFLSTTAKLQLSAPLDQLDLSLTVAQTTKYAYSTLTRLTFIYLTVGVIVLLLVTVTSIITGKRLTAPLINLTQLANQIAREDILDQQLPPVITSRDEITQLATAFDTMLDRLRESRQTLETRVTERTCELANTSQILNTILDNAPVGITKVVDRKQVWMNRKAEEMFQYTKEEMACHNTVILYPSTEAFEALGAKAYPLLAQGLVYETVQELVKKDGTSLLIRLIGKALTSQDMSQGSIWLLEDISDRNRAEKLLKESEEKFRTIANYTYAWEIWESPQGDYLYCSPSCERITGYPAQAFMADPGLFERLIHPEDLQKWKKHQVMTHDRTLMALNPEQQQAEEIDFRVVLPDGNIRWVSHTCYAIHSEDGRYLGQRISNRDISDRKKTEEALRQSEETLKGAQTVAEIGSWRLNIPENHLEWSEETYNIFGIPPEQGINVDSFFKAVHPDDRDMLRAAWSAALAGAPYNITHRIITGNMILWVQERVTIERDGRGRPLVGIGTIQNITSRKVAEDKLHAYAEMRTVLLREVNHRVKNNLIAIIDGLVKTKMPL
jgi:PAS domain S-box-containing protein